MKVGDKVRFKDGLCNGDYCLMAKKDLIICRTYSGSTPCDTLHELKPCDSEYSGLCNGNCSEWESELELIEEGESNA